MAQMAAPPPGDLEAPTAFADVWPHELAQIQERRRRYQPPGSPAEPPGETLVGLALSGGGIRSATFSLGVLQGLHSLGVLHIFDYLSTVSGGGFAGGWWTAWLSREKITRAHLRAPETLAWHLVQHGLVPWPAAAAVPVGGPIVGGLLALASRAFQSVRAMLDRIPGAIQRRPLRDVLDELVFTAEGASQRAVLERELEDVVVDELNVLVARPQLAGHAAFVGLSSTLPPGRLHNLDLLFTRYPEQLERVFPRAERLDSARSADYRDAAIPDGAIAAGADPLHHLRLFANYLTPRKGLLSPDTWRAAAVVTRNLILTWFILIPMLMALIFAGHVLLVFLALVFNPDVASELFLGLDRLAARAMVAARPIATVLILLVAVTVLWMRRNNGGNLLTHNATLMSIALMIGGLVFGFVLPGNCGDAFGPCVAKWWNGPSWGAANWWWLVLTLALAGSLFWWIRRHARADGTSRPVAKQVEANLASRWHGYLLSVLALTVAVFALSGFGHELVSWAVSTPWTKFASGVVGAATGFSALFTALKGTPSGGRDSGETEQPSLVTRIVFAVTPVLVLVVVALVGAWVAREALAWTYALPGTRMALLTIMALSGIGICLVYAGYEVAGGTPDAPATFPTMFAAGALLSVILVVLAFGLSGTGRDWQTAFSRGMFFVGLEIAILLAALAPMIAVRPDLVRGPVVGLIAIAMTAPLLLRVVALGFPATSDNDPVVIAYIAVAWLAVAATWVIALGWMADPNAIGLHGFYKARLVRAYLGASNPRRREAGADINDPAQDDDLPLTAAVRSCQIGGPYPLVNTTLNLVGGRDLTTAQRTAAAFVLSPLFSGSVRTGYRSTSEYMGGAMTLGAAITASGAAASPNMGSRTPSAALALLLAFFNVRLGLWVPTPHFPYWRSPQARVWPYYLLLESLSQTNDLLSYCYLTDGGHFDNTGLYPLIERACRYIVIVDDGADPEPCFEDMGDVIRRCRIDFGAEITLKPSGFRKTSGHLVGGHETALASITLADGKKATIHYAVGSVQYSRAHLCTLGRDPGLAPRPGVETGTIVWIKPSITGDEPVDVTQYALQNAAFPQQSTADQWFDEAQFESYRQLGLHSIERAFADAVQAAREPAADPRHVFGLDRVGPLFDRLAAGPAAPPPPERLRATVRFE